jgi:hypothetical protein
MCTLNWQVNMDQAVLRLADTPPLQTFTESSLPSPPFRILGVLGSSTSHTTKAVHQLLGYTQPAPSTKHRTPKRLTMFNASSVIAADRTHISKLGALFLAVKDHINTTCLCVMLFLSLGHFVSVRNWVAVFLVTRRYPESKNFR